MNSLPRLVGAQIDKETPINSNSTKILTVTDISENGDRSIKYGTLDNIEGDVNITGGDYIILEGGNSESEIALKAPDIRIGSTEYPNTIKIDNVIFSNSDMIRFRCDHTPNDTIIDEELETLNLLSSPTELDNSWGDYLIYQDLPDNLFDIYDAGGCKLASNNPYIEEDVLNNGTSAISSGYGFVQVLNSYEYQVQDDRYNLRVGLIVPYIDSSHTGELSGYTFLGNSYISITKHMKLAILQASQDDCITPSDRAWPYVLGDVISRLNRVFFRRCWCIMKDRIISISTSGCYHIKIPKANGIISG